MDDQYLNATWLTNLTVPPLDSNFISRLFSRTLFLNDEEKIKFIAKEFHLRRVQMNYIQPETKNDELARKFRIEGNNILFNHSTRIAILCNSPATEIYTKSIAYATPQSQEQSLAYGDRSAVSMMYQRYPHCLLDIDRALHIGYPDELLAVLYSRRLRCLATMERPQEDIDVALKKTRDALMWMDPGSKERKQIQELLDSGIYRINPLVNYEPPAAPCRCIIPKIEGPFQEIRDAEAIGLRYSPDSGRYLVATRDIQPGEIIARTEVYVKMLAMQERRYLVCAICGEKTSIGVPCEECVNTIYCSDYCQDIAWHEYHEFECQLLNILTKLGVPVGYHIAIRTTLKAISTAGGVDELKARIDDIDRAENGEIRGFVDNKFDCSTYAAVYIAAGCKEIHPATILMGCIVSIFAIFYLATSTTVLGHTFPPSLEIFQTDHLISFLARLIVKNLAYNIVDLPEEIDVRSSRPEFVDVSAYDLLLKHNCFPNVHVLKRNAATTVIARHPISEGEILTDDLYGVNFMMADKATRQAMHRVFFNNEECNCRACVENWPSREGIRNAADMPEIPDTARKLINVIEANLVGLNDSNPYIELQKLIRLVELYYQHALPCGELYQREQEIRYIYHQYMV